MPDTLTLNEARTVIAAAEKRAEEIGQPQNIAVVDDGGNLISHVRMDGAWLGSVDISINKAWTARSFDTVSYTHLWRGLRPDKEPDQVIRE